MVGRAYLISTVRKVRESGRIALCGYFLAGFPNPTEFYRVQIQRGHYAATLILAV